MRLCVPVFCVCAPNSYSNPLFLASVFILPFKAVLHAFFLSLILSHWLYQYLYNYFAATFIYLFVCLLHLYFTSVKTIQLQ